MVAVVRDILVEKRKWMTDDEFMDILAISQTLPGLMAVNTAIFVGYRLGGTKGSIVATLGSILPPFFIILAIAMIFTGYKDNPVVEAIFKGIRPAVVALIAVPTFRLGQRAKLNKFTIWIPVVCALAIWALGVSPIYIIIIAGLAGYLYGRFFKGTDSTDSHGLNKKEPIQSAQK